MITLNDIAAAAQRIHPYVHRTPLLHSRSLSDLAGVEVRLKCENLQRAGSFKIRGAMNALLQLPAEQRSRGVVAFSSGNHAQGVALAAKLLGIPATIVMPEGAMQSKVDATRGYGARVVQSGVTAATRGDAAEAISKETGATLVPPFDDDRVIAGAGTVGLEIAEDWPQVSTVVLPLGGGGLLAGTALAIRSMVPDASVFGVEPAAGDDGRRSLLSGEIVTIDPPDTIADGARTMHIGVRNFDLIRKLVTSIEVVTDEELLETLRFAIYRTKLVMEPTGALGIAALLHRKIIPAGPVAIVVSGGNLDFNRLCD